MENCRFEKKAFPLFLSQTSELNSCSNYEYFSDFFTYIDEKDDTTNNKQAITFFSSIE